jgi:4'-phosphopantetheinyl transferase
VPERAAIKLARVSLSRVARHEAALVARWLHPAERDAAAALAVPKRRLDYVAGRVAAKRALAQLGADVPAAIEVRPEVGLRAGAPRALGPAGLLAAGLSITHGAGWGCAAAVARGQVGVDLERVEARHPAFLDEAFAEGELERWAAALGADADDPRTVTVAWCAKEALLKRAGVGLRAALR